MICNIVINMQDNDKMHDWRQNVMAKNWTDDSALLESIAGNLFEALPPLPKRLVRVDAITREFDMPFSHIQIMCMLQSGGMSIGEISKNLGIAKPNITPLLDHLHERGLVERVRSEKDRRVVNVELLPEGKAVADKLRVAIADQVAAWPECVSTAEAKRLNNALACLINLGRLLAENS